MGALHFTAKPTWESRKRWPPVFVWCVESQRRFRIFLSPTLATKRKDGAPKLSAGTVDSAVKSHLPRD